MTDFQTATRCRISGTTLSPVLDLGIHPLGNGFRTPDQPDEEFFFPLKLGFSEDSAMAQLIHQPLPQLMFHENYAFYSGTSIGMTRHFENFATELFTSKSFDSSSLVVEIGCNDGIFLKHFADRDIRHLGIEPSGNVAHVANDNGVRTISEFFTSRIAESIADMEGKADVIFAANVLCHIPTLNDVIRGCKLLLKHDGLIIFEDPYLGDVVRKTSYDQIYDEHVFLFSALSVKYAFGLHGLELVDVKPQPTHGGSMRYYLAHKGEHRVSDSVIELLQREVGDGLDRIESLDKFRKNVENSRERLVYELHQLRNSGANVAGYGATSKSTTILNYCQIDRTLIPYICDTTPAKQGKVTPGKHIPVESYEYFQSHPVDVAVLFAWNHFKEIQAKELDFVSGGGRFLTHVPTIHYV